MLRFVSVGFTASKMIKFQRERSLALFVWPQQSRRYVSNDDASRQKELKEMTKRVLANGILTPGLRAEIHCTPDPVIKKLYASLLKSVEIFKDEEAAAKLGSDFKGKQVSGLKSGITIACNPHTNGQSSYSLAELRNDYLLILWDMMKVAGKPHSDFPELQQVYGLMSTTLLRDIFLSFQVTAMDLLTPSLIEMQQWEWDDKIRNWSESGHELDDLKYFHCTKLLDLQVKGLNLNSLLQKKFGVESMGGFIEIFKFAHMWSKVSSLEARRLGMYYVVDDEGVEGNSGFKLLGLFGKGGSTSIKSIDSDLMQTNAQEIAVCLSKLS